MDINNDQLAKTLVSLIDETLEEIEELKKSKFSAAEIKIEGPGEGVAGKPTNGELDAKKAEKEDEEDEDKEVEKKEKEDKEEKEGEEKEESVEKGVLDEAEKEPVKKKEDKEDEEKEEKEEEEKEEIKKSDEVVTEELIKSYIDTRISPLENKLSTIIDMVNKIADQPLERKSIPAGSVVALKKNIGEEVEALSKSEITNKLFELKKNGTVIDSLDMVKAELGTDIEATIIANKYGLK